MNNNKIVGRASSSSVIDIFITLLSLGKTGYLKLLKNKELLCAYLQEELSKLYDKNKTLITKLSSNSTTTGKLLQYALD